LKGKPGRPTRANIPENACDSARDLLAFPRPHYARDAGFPAVMTGHLDFASHVQEMIGNDDQLLKSVNPLRDIPAFNRRYQATRA
jgi:hypothetical protein